MYLIKIYIHFKNQVYFAITKNFYKYKYPLFTTKSKLGYYKSTSYRKIMCNVNYTIQILGSYETKKIAEEEMKKMISITPNVLVLPKKPWKPPSGYFRKLRYKYYKKNT